MTIDIALIVITLGGFLAAFVNAAFATGGVYIVLLSSISVLPVSAAIPLQFAFSVSSLFGRVFFFWKDINWSIVRTFALGCLIGVALGTVTFANLPDQLISLLLGFVLLLMIWLPNAERPALETTVSIYRDRTFLHLSRLRCRRHFTACNPAHRYAQRRHHRHFGRVHAGDGGDENLGLSKYRL